MDQNSDNRNSNSGRSSLPKKLVSWLEDVSFYCCDDTYYAGYEFYKPGQLSLVKIDSASLNGAVDALLRRLTGSPQRPTLVSTLVGMLFNRFMAEKDQDQILPAYRRTAVLPDKRIVRQHRPGCYVIIEPTGEVSVSSVAPVHMIRINDTSKDYETSTWIPEPDFSHPDLELLWKYIPCSETDRELILGFIFFSWLHSGFYNVLLLQGPPKSGKTTVSWMLKKLIDPGFTNNFSLHNFSLQNDLTLYATTRDTDVLLIDNVSSVSRAASDLLCCIAEGGYRVNVRLIYTQVYIPVKINMPVILNSISSEVSAGDLLNRSILIRSLQPSNYVDATELRKSFHNDMPRILGGLYQCFAGGYAKFLDPEFDPGVPTSIGRCAAFSRLAAACAYVYGDMDACVSAMVGNSVVVKDEAIELNIVGRMLRELFASHPDAVLKGTTLEIVRQLNEYEGIAKEFAAHNVNSIRFGMYLSQIVNDLRDDGILVDKRRSSRGTLYTIKRADA